MGKKRMLFFMVEFQLVKTESRARKAPSGSHCSSNCFRQKSPMTPKTRGWKYDERWYTYIVSNYLPTIYLLKN